MSYHLGSHDTINHRAYSLLCNVFFFFSPLCKYHNYQQHRLKCGCQVQSGSVIASENFAAGKIYDNNMYVWH